MPQPDKPSHSPKTFSMIRGSDESGVSGTGKVLEGVLFSDGTVVVRWLTPHVASSTAVYTNMVDFEQIHIYSHPTNKTRIIWHA
jgi:hypothetical protein